MNKPQAASGVASGLVKSVAETAAEAAGKLAVEEGLESGIKAAAEAEGPELVKCTGWLGLFGCFTADTRVITGVNADGTYETENIQDVKVGDMVLTRDANDPSGALEEQVVTGTEVHTVYFIREVTFRLADGTTEAIDTTDSHPFYVEGMGWTAAQDLGVGDVLSDPDGQIITVTSSAEIATPEGVEVYNFTVANDHSYFVEQANQLGMDGMWVHNSCDGIWNVVRKSYWKGVALLEQYRPSGLYSGKNLIRMADGLAPQFEALVEKEGQQFIEVFSKELHHDVAQRTAMFFVNYAYNLRQVTPWEHEAIDAFRFTGSKLIEILRDIDVF